MYSKKIREASKFRKQPYSVFYKDGIQIGRRMPDGKIEIFHHSRPLPVITRWQAYRIWRKKFSKRPCWMLPAAIRMGTELDDGNIVRFYPNGAFREEVM